MDAFTQEDEHLCQKVKVEEISYAGPLQIDAFISLPMIMKASYQEGKKKLQQNIKQIIFLSLLTGIQFCLGIHVALMITTNMDTKTYLVGKTQNTLLYTTKHSYSYTRNMVIGGNLFIENIYYFTIGLVNRQMKFTKISINLVLLKKKLFVQCFKKFLTYFINLSGTLLYTVFLGYLSNQFDSETMKDQLSYLTTKKLNLGFGYTLVNGIGGGIALGLAFILVIINILIITFVFKSNGSKTVICKLCSAWIPYVAFTSMGFEHYIENFFMIACSFMYGIDGSVAKFLFLNILPVTLGNIIGVAGIICLSYTTLFFSKEQQQKLRCFVCEPHM